MQEKDLLKMKLCEVLDNIPHNKVSVFEIFNIYEKILLYFHKPVFIYDSFLDDIFHLFQNMRFKFF